MQRFQRPRGRVQHETPRIKNSRFLATLAPVRDEAEARAAIAAVAEQFPDARHHCWAWRLGAEGRLLRFNDDGEPGGSAGRPILARLEAKEVSDAVLVVSRWFGGVKLGAGGLVRAYGGAAAAVIEQADLQEQVPMRRLCLRFPYELSGAVQSVLNARSLTPCDSRFEVEVEMDFHLPAPDAQALELELEERLAGRAQLELGPIEF